MPQQDSRGPVPPRHDRPGGTTLLMGQRLPPHAPAGERSSAVDVHQLWAGHWSGSVQWRHRVGQNLSRRRPQCPDTHCRAALCVVCREEADTPRHILLRWPALMGTRHRLLGTISPSTGRAELHSSSGPGGRVQVPPEPPGYASPRPEGLNNNNATTTYQHTFFLFFSPCTPEMLFNSSNTSAV